MVDAIAPSTNQISAIDHDQRHMQQLRHKTRDTDLRLDIDYYYTNG